MDKSEISAMVLPVLAEENTSQNLTVTSSMNTSSTDARTNSSLFPLASYPLFRAAVWIYRIIVVVIFVLGVFGNTMTIILQRRIGRGSNSGMSVFISSLAVSDSAVLVFLGTSLYLYSFEIDITNFHEVFCRTVYWSMYVLGMTSSWILVAMTLQRAASILWPLRVNSAWTARRAQTTVLVIVVISTLLNFHIMYGHSLQSLSSGKLLCFFVSEEYGEFFDTVWPSIDISLSSFLPFFLLITSNIVLINRVKQSMREARQTLAAGSTDQIKIRQQKTSSMTLTLVCVSVAFLLLTSPLCVLSVIQNTGVHASRNMVEASEIAANYFFEAIGNLLALANNAINFYIYILTGSRYRAALASLFGPRETKKMTTNVTRSTVVTQSSVFYIAHPLQEGDQ